MISWAMPPESVLINLSRPRQQYRLAEVSCLIGILSSAAAFPLPFIIPTAHGLVLTLLGDPGRITYKKSRRGDAAIDRAVAHVLAHSGRDYSIVDFEPFGHDERQFCSPGINLPMGCLMRTPNGQYPEYHTSGDNLSLVKPVALADSWATCLATIDVLEHNRVYQNLKPHCEPQLGRHGLYKAYGERQDKPDLQRAVLWVLNLADGTNPLLDITERSGLSFTIVREAAELLVEHQLLDLGAAAAPRSGHVTQRSASTTSVLEGAVLPREKRPERGPHEHDLL